MVPNPLAHIASAGLLLSTSGFAVAEPRHLEVFTAADVPIERPIDLSLQHVNITVYPVDGLARLEASLSTALPGDPIRAQPEALRRIGALNHAALAEAKAAATGLAKALRYGLDRHPAIVIDGSVILYGVTDLGEANRRYRDWQAAEPR